MEIWQGEVDYLVFVSRMNCRTIQKSTWKDSGFQWGETNFTVHCLIQAYRWLYDTNVKVERRWWPLRDAKWIDVFTLCKNGNMMQIISKTHYGLKSDKENKWNIWF